MSFQPRMSSRIEGIAVLDELRCRSWNGVAADVWNVACAAGARGEYVSPDARLFVVLDWEGGSFNMCLSRRGAELPPCGAPQHMSFVPAGLPLWSRIDRPLRLRHLDLHFDIAVLSERLGEDLDDGRLARPRLMFVDERLLGLANLIATACTRPRPGDDLYGDALTVALVVDLLRLGRDKPRRRPPLAAWQLRRVTAFIEDNWQRTIRLEELATLTGLSQSYFSHAFKASTGQAPHQWHMKARIRRVQEMLSAADLPLTEIAVAAGFADQAHLTRVFRRIVGEPPAAWRRALHG
ncbi:helix-turn-helix domain-containing protein [Chelatococcus reniformis]|uniref:Transcriptional regulator n=1 Tax=Chelatococcus reniformis TaxID=1494448 RepID=A0A916UPH5_9HYPH|nr:AraC family transcriptional regulator [Chelatococcus reniformis]GGC82060.1 transcriptional regulator [Chelatococcus reniformis]